MGSSHYRRIPLLPTRFLPVLYEKSHWGNNLDNLPMNCLHSINGSLLYIRNDLPTGVTLSSSTGFGSMSLLERCRPYE